MKTNGHSSRRIVLACAVIALLTIALTARVWWVNTQSYPYPYETEHHGMGEWVELDGAFIDAATENTVGYAIRVTDAAYMSLSDYLDRYGLEETETPDSPEHSAKSVLCLTVEMRNKGNEGGAIFLGEAKLIPDGLPVSYKYDSSLWAQTNPNITATAFYIGVLTDTETVQYLPYTNGAGYTTALPNVSSYELVVSNAPVRHIIDIEVDQE